MKKFRLAIVAVSALFVSSAALAEGNGDHDEPKDEYNRLNLCSPGFWKNHTDLWLGYVPYHDNSTLLAMLRARGRDSESTRRYAQAILNGWADYYYKYAVCEDIDEYYLY